MEETAKVYYSFGLDKKGRLVEVLIDGRRMDFHRAKDLDRKLHNEYVLKLRSYARDPGAGPPPPTPPTPPPPPEPIDACCLVDGGGTLWC
jgi:hypothetical protein